ncbi:hypothetical protein [Shinella sp. WSJ-2]|uniref:hypothetical protein n=1 Tax=Shinella sp. WSJ-2 TaxID=2303749 RepID=UPI001FE223B5|nr:hypothetical protein [Shinella sp. WSJ-2]
MRKEEVRCADRQRQEASRRLLILACSATKKDGPRYLPAVERYNGPLWQTLRATDPKGELAQAAFLSAHLGFRAASTPIPSYDVPMTPQIAAAMKAGNLGTRWPQNKTKKRVMPTGEHPGMHIASLTDFGSRPFASVALAGGYRYIEIMQTLLRLFRAGGYVDHNASVTVINGPIGKMRRDLRVWLTSGGSADIEHSVVSRGLAESHE